MIFERDRARILVVRGLEIQEFNGRLPTKNITLHVRASQSESEKHREHHLEGHVRTYFKELAEKLRGFLSEEKLQETIFEENRGRVQQLMLGKSVDGTVSECDNWKSFNGRGDYRGAGSF